MTSMREKIARAIFEAWASDGNSDASWEELRLMSKRDGYSRAKSIYALAFKEADAVLDALMEPTEDMSNASTATPQVRDIDWVSALLGTGISSAEDVVLASYRAMIHAARTGNDRP